MPFVEHTNHVSENFLSKSALYSLNNSNDTDDLFSKSDADSRNFLFPSHIKTVKVTLEIENRLPDTNIIQEFPLQSMGGNTYLIAEGNNDLKPGQVNAAMESECGPINIFGDTCTNSDIRNDMKENTKKEHKMNVRSLASKFRTYKRAKTAKYRMTKISKNNQKKKIVPEVTFCNLKLFVDFSTFSVN